LKEQWDKGRADAKRTIEKGPGIDWLKEKLERPPIRKIKLH